MSPGARAATAALRFYKSALSPFLPRACRYEPTCSAYAARSIRRFGVRNPKWVAVLRLRDDVGNAAAFLLSDLDVALHLVPRRLVNQRGRDSYFAADVLKLAGAIVMGKVNLHEFAAGGTSATSYFRRRSARLCGMRRRP